MNNTYYECMTHSRHPDCAMLTPNQIDLRNKLGYPTAHHSLIEQYLLPCSGPGATKAACEGVHGCTTILCPHPSSRTNKRIKTVRQR